MTIGSLFSGIGGLELGLEACGLGPVLWQAESDPYARAVLARHWPDAIRYDDVRHIDERAARPDVVCGGFPCQDISNAGKRAGIDGAKSGLWSEFARIVRVVRPRVAFVENVAALVARGLDRVLGDLAALGFDAEWGVFRAADVGAPHLRERLFILAHAGRFGVDGLQPELVTRSCCQADPRNDGLAVANAEISRLEGIREGLPGHGSVFPPGPGEIDDWDGPEPAVRRGSDGLSRRVDRLRCLGNAVVPQVAALAWRTLSARSAT